MGDTLNTAIDSIWVTLSDTQNVATSGVDPAGSKLDLYIYSGDNAVGITGTHYTANDSTFIFKFSSLRDGKYYMRIIAADKAGNVDTTYKYFIIDTQSPYIVLYAPAGYIHGPIGSLWLKVNDPEPKAKAVRYVDITLKKVYTNEYIPLHAAWIVEDTIVVDTLVVPLPAPDTASYDGYYEEYVTLSDGAGNTYYDSTLSFILDNTNPVITTAKII